jgi:hypothetical protein
VDKKLAAERVCARLEKRLANFLGCEVGDLPRLKLGTLINTLFLLLGDTHELGGVLRVDGRRVEDSGQRDCVGHRRDETGRDGNTESGHQLMRELTLDQMGKEISAAIQTLTLVQRKVIGELLLRVEKACWNFEGRKRVNEPKMGPTEFAAEVERLKAEGRLPSLETLLTAIAETRAEFALQILAARRGKKKA